MKTNLRKAIRIFAFVCVSMIFSSCQPGCENYCIPPSEEVEACDRVGGEFNYDKCKCEG